MPHSSKLANLQDIIAAPTIKDVWEKAVPLLRMMGPHRFTFVHAPFYDSLCYFTTGHEWITEEWISSIRSLDCLFRRAFDITMSMPFFWGLNWISPHAPIGDEERLFFERLANIGYANNICVPVWCVTPRHQSLLSIMTKLNEQQIQTFMSLNHANLYAIAHILNARLMLLSAEEDRSRIKLSRRECDCLRWLSTGLRNNRIVQKLGISESTIEFHTFNARRKLDAKTREEAITKALLLGLLPPIDAPEQF